jgi:DNA-binding NarL/FixJ family response regulator
MNVTVVLVERETLYRQCLALSLRASSGHRVVGEASAARQAVDLIERQRPSVVVADFALPDSNAIALAHELRRRKVEARLVILTGAVHPKFVRDTYRYGISGIALKRQPLSVIIDAIGRVSRGERYLCPELVGDGERWDDAVCPELATLTPREREVLLLVLEGRSSKEIAQSLFLSSKTVDAHRLHINRKFHTRSLPALMRFAATFGLLAVRARMDAHGVAPVASLPPLEALKAG